MTSGGDFKRLNVHAAGHHNRSMNTKRLTTNSVQVRKLDQVIVCDVGVVTTLSFDDLGAELVLNIRVLGEEVKDAREGVRRSVHAGKDESPGWERLVYVWVATLPQRKPFETLTTSAPESPHLSSSRSLQPPCWT